MHMALVYDEDGKIIPGNNDQWIIFKIQKIQNHFIAIWNIKQLTITKCITYGT